MPVSTTEMPGRNGDASLNGDAHEMKKVKLRQSLWNALLFSKTISCYEDNAVFKERSLNTVWRRS